MERLKEGRIVTDSLKRTFQLRIFHLFIADVCQRVTLRASMLRKTLMQRKALMQARTGFVVLPHVLWTTE